MPSMDRLNSKDPNAAFEQLLKDQAMTLIELLTQGHIAEAMGVIHQLQGTREQSIYNEVGKLTRALHEAIKNFHIDSRIIEDKDKAQLSQISDATDRLSYVVDMTEQSANRTMDLVEDTLPVVERLHGNAQTIYQRWQQFMRRELSADDFRQLYWHIDEFLQTIPQDSAVLKNSLCEILLAQNYQDLTGQVIHRVITLVKEIEQRLVQLMRMASQVERVTGIQAPDAIGVGCVQADPLLGQGPQINSGAADVVANQDEVDYLLSSLGF